MCVCRAGLIFRARIRIIKQLTKPLSLLFLSFKTCLKQTFLFHTGENKIPYGRKYFFIREEINFHTGESFETYGRKFPAIRMFFNYTLLLTRERFTPQPPEGGALLTRDFVCVRQQKSPLGETTFGDSQLGVLNSLTISFYHEVQKNRADKSASSGSTRKILRSTHY